MTRIKTTNPQDETRLRGLIARIAQTPIGETLLEHLEAQAQQHARYTYICFDQQLPPGASGACYTRAGVKTAAITPDADDDLLVSVLMHELCHCIQPQKTPFLDTDRPVAYGMIAMRLCEGHAFTEQLLFLRQLEECDPAAAKAGRDFMLEGRFSAAEMEMIDESVDAVLASRNEDERHQPRENLFWLTQEYIKRRYDPNYADKLKLLVSCSNPLFKAMPWREALCSLFDEYDKSSSLHSPQDKGLLWPKANQSDHLLEMLASHANVRTTPLFSLKRIIKGAALSF